MRFRRSTVVRPLLVLAAATVAAPAVPATAGPSIVGSMLDHGSLPTDHAIAPEGETIVARHVSGDMVVDWLEEPAARGDEGSAHHETPSEDGAAEESHSHEETHDHDAFAAAGDGSSETYAAASSGQGFSLFSSSPRWLPSGYTVRFVGGDARIEHYRDEFAATVRAASSATGIPVRLAAGRGGSTTPARGEITVILGVGPCGSTAVGCGGPALTSTELVSGRVWIHPRALDMSSANRLNLASHELGHALGLQHHSADWRDGRQAMHPTISGVASYRAGDTAGLRFMAGVYDQPAGQVSERRYAAGHVQVAGTLASGTRVRVAVGSKTADLTASGGRFSTRIAAPAGEHRVCVTSLDAGAGYRRALGCKDVTAPGRPFGVLDSVRGSFETVAVRGWAIDPQTADPVSVEVRRNGTLVTTAPAGRDRPDVGRVHRDYGPAHGIDLTIPAVAGANRVCVRIVGIGGGGDRELGCRDVDHAVDPVGSFETVSATDLGATVTGWALDPNTPDAVQVRVTVDGSVPAVPGRFGAGAHRPDVAQHHPAHGGGHGFAQRLTLTPGDHQICLTVVNVGLGTDRSLGCGAVHVDDPAGSSSAPNGSPTRLVGEAGVPAVDEVVDGLLGAVTGLVDL